MCDGGNTYDIDADTGALTKGDRAAPGFQEVVYTHSDPSMPLVAPANTQIPPTFGLILKVLNAIDLIITASI